MTLTQTRLTAAIMISLAPLLGTAPANAGPDTTKGSLEPADDNARARSSFRKAAAASQAGRYEEARQLLLDAWSVRQTYDIASSLAQVEIQLKRYRDAAEHLEFCIRNFAPVESEQTLDQANKAFADVKTRVATVKLSANRKGAELFVDSLGIGTEPLPAVIFVDPGPHRLAARLDGDTAERSLNAQAGKEYIADLTLSSHETKAAAVVQESKGTTIEPPPAPPAKTSYTPAIITASTGGVALVAGIVLFLESSHKDSQRQDQLDTLPGPNRCGTGNPNPSACSEIQSSANDARTFRTLAWASFGVAAAASIATYVLWPRTPSGAQVGLNVGALPTHSGFDLFAGFVGTF